MFQFYFSVFLSCVFVAQSARMQQEQQAFDAKIIEKQDECADAVEGSSRRESAWRHSSKCKCAHGFSLVGSNSECGDGSQRYFKADNVKGKDCTCKENKKCLPVETQPNFDLASYISKLWFIQQQMPTQYLPVEKNYCVTARYEIMSKKSTWGYTIQVYNQASDKDRKVMDSGTFLCAYGTDKEDPAKLAVAPCFLPKAASGPYWVLAYDEEEGYALVSGGQPSTETPLGCRTGSGVNDAGLWIFSRELNPTEGLVQKVRDIASAKGFDVSVLNDVDQTNCTGPNYDA